MPRFDPQMDMHRLNIDPNAKPIKQWWFRPEIMEAIQSEVKKLIDSGFIREEQHPDWVANIVLITKKNRKIWVCIDFHDLNEACPKDEFPLPITDVMIDNTCGFERMSIHGWILGIQSNQDVPWWWEAYIFQDTIGGILLYCHALFILKNVGATYQRAMNTIFHEHIRKIVECYVDDITVKSRARGDHIADLKTVFDIMRAHQLKMNPTKSFLGVASNKFLGFIVTSKGIHLDSKKIRSVQEMQPPKSLRELRGLQGRLAYIRKFISNLQDDANPWLNWWRKVFHLSRTMHANKHLKKSSSTSRIHLFL